MSKLHFEISVMVMALVCNKFNGYLVVKHSSADVWVRVCWPDLTICSGRLLQSPAEFRYVPPKFESVLAEYNITILIYLFVWYSLISACNVIDLNIQSWNTIIRLPTVLLTLVNSMVQIMSTCKINTVRVTSHRWNDRLCSFWWRDNQNFVRVGICSFDV